MGPDAWPWKGGKVLARVGTRVRRKSPHDE